MELWGNKADLSLSGGDPHFMSASIFKEVESLRANILVDDLDDVIDKYFQPHKKLHRLDIILDNSGIELFTDILLADFLIAKGFVKQVYLHGKVRNF